MATPLLQRIPLIESSAPFQILKTVHAKTVVQWRNATILREIPPLCNAMRNANFSRQRER